MSIKVKAVERNVSFDKSMEKWAYVMQPELYSKFKETPEFFCIADDFCKVFDAQMAKYSFKAERKRKYHRESRFFGFKLHLICNDRPWIVQMTDSLLYSKVYSSNSRYLFFPQRP